MKYDWTEKAEEAEKAKTKKKETLSKWHSHYAWLPTWWDHKFWWFHKLERKAVYTFKGTYESEKYFEKLYGLRFFDFAYWEYR